MCHDIIYPRKGESLTMQSNGIGNVSARGMQIQAVNGGVVEKVIIGSGYRNTELSQTVLMVQRRSRRNLQGNG